MIEPIAMFRVTCDNCAVELDLGDGPLRFQEVSEARDYAASCEWQVSDKKQTCPKCSKIFA